MLKDTKSLGNNKAPACESRGFVLKKKVCFLTHLLFYILSWTRPFLVSHVFLHTLGRVSLQFPVFVRVDEIGIQLRMGTTDGLG